MTPTTSLIHLDLSKNNDWLPIFDLIVSYQMVGAGKRGRFDGPRFDV
jgi:hypothetical protein